jgi:hypothetical protein
MDYASANGGLNGLRAVVGEEVAAEDRATYTALGGKSFVLSETTKSAEHSVPAQ